MATQSAPLTTKLHLLRLLAATAALSLSTSPAPAAEVDVYLIAGQSNAINFADDSAEGTSEVGFQLHYARTSKDFLPVYTGIAEQFSSNLLDPNRSVTALANTLSLGDVGVFAFARIGTPLAIEPGRSDTWYPGDDPENGLLYDGSMYANFLTWTNARLAELTADGHTPVVRGLFWFQGERDGVLGTPGDEYETNFTNLLYRLRQDFGPSLPVVAARIREVGADIANRVAVNRALENIAARDPLLGLVPTAELSWISATNVHLTAAGYFDLASLWAAEMLALQNAPILWEPARSTSGKADLIEGQPVLALNAGTQALTISGAGATGTSTVSFAAADFTNLGTLDFRPASAGDTATAHVVESVYAPLSITSTGSPDFDALVASLSTPNASPEGISSGTFRLDGLTPGQTYLVQIFTNSQHPEALPLTTTYGDQEAAPNTVTAASGNPVTGVQTDDYGHFVVGQFTAEATSQSLSITLNNPGAGTPEGPELLTNGDFESPLHTRNDGTDPDAWTVIETTVGSNPDRQVRTKNEEAFTGSMGLYLGAGNSNRDGQLYQTIATEPGKQYELSGHYISPQGNLRQAFAIDIIDGQGIGGTTIATTGTVEASNPAWRRLALAFTAASDSTTVLISDRGTLAADNATLALDAISAVELGDPPSPTLSNVHFNALLVTAPSHFQLWSRERGIPADPAADSNGDGISNAIAFSTGAEDLPVLQSGDRVGVTVQSEALEDGFTIGLEFSTNLGHWTRATASTAPLSMLEPTPAANGDLTLTFALDRSAHDRLFWRLVADAPAP